MEQWTTFSIVGDVDDGKSTLTGRLVLGAQNFYLDQMPADHNLAKFSDGLRSERELGITIDIAYRFLVLNGRRYRLIDCPGHDKYFAKTVTGLSLVDAVILVVDIQRSLTEQSLKLLEVIKALQIEKLIIAVNKVDSISYAAEKFVEVEENIKSALSSLGISSYDIIPISGLNDLNITQSNISWFQGPTLLQLLDFNKTWNQQCAAIVQNVSQNVVYAELISGHIKKRDDWESLFQGFNEVEDLQHRCSFSFIPQQVDKYHRGYLVTDYPKFESKVLKAYLFPFDLNPLNNVTLYLNYREYPVSVTFLQTYEGYIRVTLESSEIIQATSYSKFKSFGRFILLDQEKRCVAAGIID